MNFIFASTPQAENKIADFVKLQRENSTMQTIAGGTDGRLILDLLSFVENSRRTIFFCAGRDIYSDSSTYRCTGNGRDESY